MSCNPRDSVNVMPVGLNISEFPEILLLFSTINIQKYMNDYQIDNFNGYIFERLYFMV